MNAVFKLYVCQKRNLTVLPITTKFSSCFPPCLFSNSAFTSICGLALLDFFAGVGTIFCSSETCTTWGERVDFEAASSTPEATLASSGNSPFWGVLGWPFSSARALGKKTKQQNPTVNANGKEDIGLGDRNCIFPSLSCKSQGICDKPFKVELISSWIKIAKIPALNILSEKHCLQKQDKKKPCEID